MMPRIVQMFFSSSLLALCTTALIVGLACGKYGRPQRISQPEPPAAASVDTGEQDRDDERKSAKP